MNIGFIGCGNMASAIISSITSKRNGKDKIFVYDIYSPLMDNTVENFNTKKCSNENDVVNKSDIVFLAVKPNVIGSVAEKIKNNAEKNSTLLVSIAAGKSLDSFAEILNDKCRLVRVMPNINAKVGEAISAYCCNALVNDNDKSVIEALLNCTGKCMALDEAYFPLFGVIGGCAPAFSYMFIDALARAGVKNGMKKDEALKIAAQTVYGSAKMILESDEHPWKLIDNVCSPGGTTIEGVLSLKADGFETAIQNAVDKSLDKDKKL